MVCVIVFLGCIELHPHPVRAGGSITQMSCASILILFRCGLDDVRRVALEG
jgi:hypothetical protein